jgi:hypothetical protein
VFVDWAWASQGAAWIDVMNLICGVAMDRTDIDVDGPRRGQSADTRDRT